MINLHLQFKDVAEMRVCLTEMLTGVPRTLVATASAEGSSLPTAQAAPAPAPAVKEAAAKAAPKSEKPVATQPVSATATPATTAPAEPAAASESPSNVEYAQVGSTITKMVADGAQAKVVAALAKFNAKRGPDLKPEQYADFLTELAA